MQELFDPDRLRTPLLREDAGQAGRPVEWEEAIGILRERIGSLVTSGSGDRIAIVDGRGPSLGTHLIRSWTQSFPGARYIPLRIEAAIDLLVQEFLGVGPGGRLRFDLERTGTLLSVGAEILEVDGSPVSQMREHAERRESRRLGGAPTIYLGPRQSPTATKADLWVPCQPGQEREILLAFAEALSREHPDGSNLLAEYSRWIPEARDAVEFARKYSLENVARHFELSQDNLEAVVRALADIRPSVTLPGPGILRRANGTADARAALALNLWTDGFQRDGGLSWERDPLDEVCSRLGIGSRADRQPSKLIDVLQPLLEIKRSPVDVLICIGANLVHELPGTDQIARALSHVPFMVYFSTHEDETSQLSHLTLPTLLSSESWDLPAPAWGVSEPTLQVQRPALVPVIDGLSVEDLVLALDMSGDSKPGFKPTATNSRELLSEAVTAIVSMSRGRLLTSDSALPLRDVDANTAREALLSGGAIWEDESGEPVRHLQGVRVADEPTPPLVDLAPGQVWLVPFDAPAIQGGRVLNRPMMMELSGHWHGIAWDSWVEIHLRDAERFGIGSGDRVRIRGPRAEVVCRAVVTGSVIPGVVAAPVGFGLNIRGREARGEGANILELPNSLVDDVTGAPAWGPVPVFLDKA
jgi:anaerobic selenocysteine-containing dehydrogenase